jgi:hypothetical protein
MKKTTLTLLCAWVLWGLSSTGNWHPSTAYPTFEDCREDKKLREQLIKDRKFDYECFPDTIDPRTRSTR